MERRTYTVMKRNGRWGICASGAPFFECDSYHEALEISRVAAAVLAPKPSPGAAVIGGGIRPGIDGSAGSVAKDPDKFTGRLGTQTGAEKHLAAASMLVDEEGEPGSRLEELGAGKRRSDAGH